MKKYIALCLLICGNLQTFAESSMFPTRYENVPEVKLNKVSPNSTSFDYASIGVSLPIPIPHVNIGHRERLSKNTAIDVSAGFATAFVASSIGIQTAFLRYINESSFYFSGSLGMGIAFVPNSSNIPGIFPGIGFGKENESGIHEISMSPISFTTAGIYTFPALSYSYGFKF